MWLLNGERRHCIDASDRGLQYGDGVFETLEILHGKPLFFEQHYRRLSLGCQILLIPCPEFELLHAEAMEIARDHQRAVLKLIVTRGVGGRGYRQPPVISPTRLFSVHPYPNYPLAWSREGVSLRICQKRLSINPDLSGIKHLNRLEQVLARAEWTDDGIQEGLMLDAEHQVVEGTMSNVFVVKQGELLTPLLDRCGIAGIVRGLILDAAESLLLSVRETRLTLADLQTADELFLSNSIIGIWPVNCFEQRHWAVGPVTQRLQAWYEESRELESQP